MMADQQSLMPVWRFPDWINSAGLSSSASLKRMITRRADVVHRAELDGIPQVGPILAAFGEGADVVKRRIGKGLWKQVHHSSLLHNCWRARIKLTTTLDFGTIMKIPTGALSEAPGLYAIRGAAAVVIAAHMATNRQQMREAAMLASDLYRMRGQPKREWSLRRLREEHDRLARELAVARASGKAFAPAWTADVDGYRFTRLISAADFAAEGAMMKHCIAGYADDAAKGREVAFAIDGEERASVSFSDCGHVELKGRLNAKVSAATRDATMKMWAQFTAENSWPPSDAT